MPVIKELQDLVDLLGEHDEKYQRQAVVQLARVLNMAEQDIADSHLSPEEQRDASHERFLAHFERRFGKEKADKLRARGRHPPW